MQIESPFYIDVSSMDRPRKIWLFSDLHMDNAGCAEDEVDAMVEEIRRDKYARWIGLGDYCDCITPDDPRWDYSAVSKKTRDGVFEGLADWIFSRIVDKLKPIAHKCLGLHEGNHEYKFDKKSMKGLKKAITKEVANYLGVRYLGYSSLFDLVFRKGKKKEVFKMYCHHGKGGATTTAGKTREVKKMFGRFEADIYCMGHGHEKIDIPGVRLYQDGRRLRPRKMWGIMTGGYLLSAKEDVTLYPELAAYDPVDIGSAAAIITPETRRLAIEKR